ncbi:MAG: T9SS type A sorting domain-containing protein [Bacteroidetes bacterium]|nr:T9SS type A sorting domain-containing protein [Bacteroidota bacterium]
MKLNSSILRAFLFLVMLRGSHIFLYAQPTSGLIGYFKFDGNVTNSGSGSITATTSNTSYTTNAAGAANKAIQFAGSTSSYVSVADNGNLGFSGDFSVTFGVYLASSSVSQGFVDCGLNYGGYGVWYFSADNTLRLNFKNGTVGSNLLPAGQWKAVCAMRSSGTLYLYVNGVLAASAAEGSMATGYPYSPVLGQMYYFGTGGNYNPLGNGSKIDELRFYNRALNGAEITSLVGASLPLNLGDFYASKQSSGIVLNWQTLNEANTAYFDIEHSSNGIEFNSIGKVNASGFSSNSKTYSFTDAQPYTGTNYYRLKMVDIDGRLTYSRIVVIKNNTTDIKIEVFPNPVADLLQLQLPAQQKQLTHLYITDASGKIVYTKEIILNAGNNATSIPVSYFPAGLYRITIENNDGKQTTSFMKQ